MARGILVAHPEIEPMSPSLEGNKAELDVFLELSCFFHDPTDVGPMKTYKTF